MSTQHRLRLEFWATFKIGGRRGESEEEEEERHSLLLFNSSMSLSLAACCFCSLLFNSDVGSLHSFDMEHETEEIARKMASIGLWCIQVSPSSRPTMSKVLEMFERSADELEIPPKHCFYSAIQ
uniref:Uncharacterized protein n=1 Tax=Oryza nivara TaxID=4536 RepID=A0A0E0GXR4_ORYNI